MQGSTTTPSIGCYRCAPVGASSVDSLFFNTTTSARENPTVQPPNALLMPLPFASQDQLGTVADDDTLPSTSYSRRSKKKSHKARERERPRGDTDSVRVEKARRQALESPKLRDRTPSDINAARIGASAQKAAALEDEIRRLQRDVKHHREAEANLQAAMDAAAESWKCERAGTGASSEEEERLEDVRLTAAVAENARLEDELIREVRARRTVEEERFAAREEIRRIERDSSSKLESLVRERDELKERASALEEQLTNALKAAPSDLSSVREREDALKAELNSARLEATNARSRVEETLRELSLVREAESKKAEKVGKKKLQASPRASTASPRASTASPRASTASPKSSTSSPRASTVSPRASTASPRASTAKEMDKLKGKLADESRLRQAAEAEVQRLAKEVNSLRADTASAQRLTTVQAATQASPAPMHADADLSRQLADALQSKEMADAQASMLRSCLDDAEELLEESKSSRNELERKLKTMTEAQLQANNLAPELLARAETAEQNADIAMKKANAAEEAMKLAKEDAIKDRAALQAEHNAAVSALEMRLRTSEESVSESSLRPVEVHLQIGDQLHAVQMEDAVTQAETAAIELEDAVIQTDPQTVLTEDAQADVSLPEESSTVSAELTAAESAAESARSTAKEALEQASTAVAQMKEAEHRAHQLEQDLAVALSDSRTAMEELSRLRSELKSAHSELPLAPSPDSERKPGPLVAVEASDNGTALGTPTPPSESLRALEVRLVEERDASARLKLDLNAAEIKIAENEAALAVLRASHDVQVQTIKELTSRVEASRPSSDANDTSSTDDKHAELIAMVEDKDKQIAAALARLEVAEKKSLEAEREVASLTLSLQVERDGVKVLLEDTKRASQQADTELKTATERFASELKATTDRAAAELKATQERFEKELEEARKVVSDLAASEQRFVSRIQTDAETAAKSASELESKYEEAKHRAEQAETALAVFREEATAALERKTEEFIAATRSASESESAKSAAEAEIMRLNHALAVHEPPAPHAKVSAEMDQLRLSLAETERALQSHQFVQSQLESKLRVAEGALADQASELSAKREDTGAKLDAIRDELKASRAETAKAEWTISELNSRLEVEQSRANGKRLENERLKLSLADLQTEFSAERLRLTEEMRARQSAAEVKVLDTEQKLAVALRELADAVHVAEMHAAESQTSKERLVTLTAELDSATHSVEELELKCSNAEHRATEAERALGTFKTEANATLRLKTEELSVVSIFASQAEEAKMAAEAEIRKLQNLVEDGKSPSTVDETLKAEVAELRAALTEALNAQSNHDSTHTELRLMLEAAETAYEEREAAFQSQRESLEARLNAAEERAEAKGAENTKLEWSVSVLHSRMQTEESRTVGLQSEIDRLSTLASQLEEKLKTTSLHAETELATREELAIETRDKLAETRRELEAAKDSEKSLIAKLTAADEARAEAASTAARLVSESSSQSAANDRIAREAESALAAFREEAQRTLEAKTSEILAVTRAVAEIETAKRAADEEIIRLKSSLEKYEEESTADAAVKAVVVDLRAALAEALDVQQGQQSSLTELTIRLEAAETASVEQQKDFLSRHEELVAKLEKSEETLKASRTEAAKTEWTLSELKSRLQVDELKLTDAAEQRSIIETKLSEAERALEITRAGLEDTRREAERYTIELGHARRRLEKQSDAIGELESRCTAAELRASKAEAGLATFKRETLLSLERVEERTATSGTTDLDAFRKAATASLETKTSEVIQATRAAAQAMTANDATQADIETMRRTLARVEEKASLEVKARVSAVERAAREEVTRLHAHLEKSAADSERARYLEGEVSSLRSELKLAREAHAEQNALHDELRAQLDTVQGLYQKHQSATVEQLAGLRAELEVEQGNAMEANRKEVAANIALSAKTREMETSVSEHTQRTVDLMARVAELEASKASSDEEVARLENLCSELKQCHAKELGDVVHAETTQLTDALRALQEEHEETLDLCATLREQLECVSEAAERSAVQNERRVEEAEAAVSAAEARLRETRERDAELGVQAMNARVDAASMNAMRASLEDEILAKDAVIASANEVRDRALDDCLALQRRLSASKSRAIELEAEKQASVAEVARLSEALRSAGTKDALSSALRAELIEEQSESARLRQKLSTFEAALDTSEGDFSQILRASVDRESALQSRAEKAEQRERALHTQIIQSQSVARDAESAKAEIEAELKATALELSIALERSSQAAKELSAARGAAAESAKKYGVAEGAVERKVAASNESARKAHATAAELRERLESAEVQIREHRDARESAESKVLELESQLAADGKAALEKAKEALREETELLLQGAQAEIEKALLEVQDTEWKLEVSQARVSQLEREVIRLQKHEHALHSLLGEQ